MNRERPSLLLTNTIIVGLLTVLGYIAAYEYEIGFCLYWNIPNYLIELSLTQIISTCLAVFFFALSLVFVANLSFVLFGRLSWQNSWLLKRVVIINSLSFAYLYAVAYGYGFGTSLFVTAVLSLFANLFICFIPWLQSRYDRDQVCTVSEGAVQSDKDDAKDIYDWVISSFGKSLAIIIMLGLPLVVVGAQACGRRAAIDSNNYFVIESQGLICIKKYGDTYLLRPIDLSTMRVRDNLLVWRGDDISKYNLSSCRKKKPIFVDDNNYIIMY